ncbi:MAG: DUF1800 domain-containing protein [Pseudomonadota bacterium]
MGFTPTLAERRFGYGLSPRVSPPHSVEEMLAALIGPDVMASQFPVGTFRDLQEQHLLFDRFRRHARSQGDSAAGKASREKAQEIRRAAAREHLQRFVQLQLRRIATPDAFRERLAAFWADHFTALGKSGLLTFASPLFIEDVIRPRMTGRFSDMLRAVAKHPLMLHALDQDFSAGPGSVAGQRRGRGLNENFARELLELHTLGVDGPYDQVDVRALALLLTGLSRGRGFDFVFRPNFAEQAGQIVLGRSYPAEISEARIDKVLTDLALHPGTARHLARKLAVHFIADAPPTALVEAMTAAFLETDGDLLAVYRAMLMHPQAWETPMRNLRRPDEFISTSLRALGPEADALERLKHGDIRGLFLQPLARMGQTWLRPAGPDGWSEQDAAWATPQGLAGRLDWAMQVPRRLMAELPDPRDFVQTALGSAAPERVAFAAQAAESRAEAIGLVLISPAMQRR